MADTPEADTTPEMVRYEEVDDGRVAVITLDRPEARNAPEQADDLRAERRVHPAPRTPTA